MRVKGPGFEPKFLKADEMYKQTTTPKHKLCFPNNKHTFSQNGLKHDLNEPH